MSVSGSGKSGWESLAESDMESLAAPPAVREKILEIVVAHPCARHPLFDCLAEKSLSRGQIAALLRNYDAHASVLRRLLLHAATLMPEEAVTFVLENVRNEYGNGDYSQNHQSQLRGLAWSCGIGLDEFMRCKVERGIGDFVKLATELYRARNAAELPPGMIPAAIAAGAITGTELMAMKEFVYLQKVFARRGLQEHIWFRHVDIEAEHSDESLQLALHFAGQDHDGFKSVEYGLLGILDANIRLYDGLLEALQ